MMIVINVFSKVFEKPVTRRSDRKEFKLRYQEGEILRDDHRPRVPEIGLRDGDPPYKEGPYTIAGESFRPDQYDRLEMRYLTLTPLDEAIEIGQKAQKRLTPKRLV